ncbi:MAG: hypothetical protein GC180_12880 [Bacteroidetes bacterium]|nr:hypothetical protein [Bacteroidota bacterium]
MTETERNSWISKRPNEILIHGPSKLYIDKYLWFDPTEGIISCYTTQSKDTADHFDIFRGVDIIESAGQTGVSACAIMESVKQDKSIDELKKHFRLAFVGMGKARFHGFVKVNETLLNVCKIHQHKFRQMLISSKVYKAPAGMDVAEYFKELRIEKIDQLQVPEGFMLVAEMEDMIGRSVPIGKVYPNP